MGGILPFKNSKEFSSRSLAIEEVLVHTSNGIASAVNDEAGSNSVDGVSEEVASEVAIESEDDHFTVKLVVTKRKMRFQ